MNVESENKYKDLKKESLGISLAAQWLRTSPSDAGGVGSISGRGTKILHAKVLPKKKKKVKSLLSGPL